MKKDQFIYLLNCILFISNGIYCNTLFAEKLEGFYIIDETNFADYTGIENMIDWSANKKNKEKLIASGQINLKEDIPPPRFILPMKSHTDDPGFYVVSNYVDLNRNSPGYITDYNCGNRSYDLKSGYNHTGIDFRSWPFPWYKMDNLGVSVVAAANGVITHKRDDQFDRSCRNYYGASPNLITLTHDDGSQTSYLHLKRHSLTTKEIGDSVDSGEFLGFMGSSGFSSNPHLHFETHDKNDFLIEPFAGQCNYLNSESWWIDQLPYNDSKIVKLATSSQAPEFANCPQTEDNPHYLDFFAANDTVFVISAFQDQLRGDVTTYKVIQPDAEVYESWTHSISADYYKAATWWWSISLPTDAQTGGWIFQSEHLGIITNHEFQVLNNPINTGVAINQGMSGSWFTPQTSGSGFFVDVRPSDKFMFIGWFTHEFTDSARPESDSGTRWFTASGKYEGNVAQLNIFETRGGVFNSSQAVTNSVVGSMTFEFTDCSTGYLSFEFTDNSAFVDDFAIQRVIPDTESLCELLDSETLD